MNKLLISREVKTSNMTQEISAPTQTISATLPNKSLKKPNRELAWKVAPNLLVSFKYAWAGISYTFQSQRNFRIHVVIGALALSLSVFLHLSSIKIAIMGLTIASVLIMELLNTALESVVDLTVKQSYHELAKIAKDCAAGAVLISAIAAVFVGVILIVPPLLEVFQLALG